jgi:hypothetical protein
MTIPWFKTESPPELVVPCDDSKFEEITRAKVGPPPSEAQVAAMRFLLAEGPAMQAALLPQFQKHVPELADEDWKAIEAFFGLACVLTFHPSTDGVSYTGFVWKCLQYDYGYEHGVGIVAHRNRVVHLGMAEEAQAVTQARKDMRRLARLRKAKSGEK